jgi:hypothetical protein
MPAATRGSHPGGNGGKKGGKTPAAVKRTQVNRVFNPQAGRPYPSLRSPLVPYVVTLERNAQILTTSTSASVYGSTAFWLSQYSSGDLLVVFDQYKILEIEVWIEPSVVMSPMSASTVFYTAVDLDDANVPTSSDQLVNHAAVVSSETGTAHYHRWVPYMALAAFSGAYTSYTSSKPQWIDAASPGVQHFGIKMAVPLPDGIPRAYTITSRMLVAFRGAEI